MNCKCINEEGHGPTPHRCRCGKVWAVGVAAPTCSLPSDSGAS